MLDVGFQSLPGGWKGLDTSRPPPFMSGHAQRQIDMARIYWGSPASYLLLCWLFCPCQRTAKSCKRLSGIHVDKKNQSQMCAEAFQLLHHLISYCQACDMLQLISVRDNSHTEIKMDSACRLCCPLRLPRPEVGLSAAKCQVHQCQRAQIWPRLCR